MNRATRGALIAFSLAGALALPPAAPPHAQESPDAAFSEADRQAVRDLVGKQLEAFRTDDGETAYNYGTPAIKRLFGSADRFMEAVRLGYAPVHRPRLTIFGDLVDSPEGPIQTLFVTGPDGRSWRALYRMQKQPDGTWLINGCTLQAVRAQAA